MPPESRNYWWLNANPAIWSYSDLAPGAENNYTQYNESGSLRQVPKYFLEVQPGDLVLGYATSPQKELVCLCEITRPLENGAFHFKKLFDFPNPVPSTAWTSDPLLSYFHFQGSLFKVSQEQWDGFIGLVKERNPGMTLPYTPPTDNLEARLDAFLSSFTPTEENLEHRKQAESQRQSFLQRFPLEKLPSLTPEEYCIGQGNQDNFCWWIERGTGWFSRYFPGSSRSYGMYFNKDTSSVIRTKHLEKMRKGTQAKTDAEVLRQLILEPIHQFVVSCGESEESQVVGNSFLLKVAILYRPDDFIQINSTDWLKKIIAAFHLPSNGTFVGDNRAVKAFYDRKKKQFPERDFMQSDFITFIAKELNLKKSKSDVTAPEMEETHMPHSLNTILYGPPGTGKTHDVVNHVLSIIDCKSMPEKQTTAEYTAAKARFDELTAQGRVAFVTFHQSYGYEDFIEGIRPVLGDDATAIAYELHDGVFKTFCKRAQRPAEHSAESFGIRKDPTIWKVSLGGTGPNPTRSDCMAHGYIRIGWDEYGENITDETFKEDSAGKTILDAFVNGMQIGDVVVSCYSASETDAIGVVTGEYKWDDSFAQYKRIRKVHWLVRGIQEDIREINNGKSMVLATVYRLKIALPDILAIVERHLHGNVDSLENLPKCVFVIDEINRGNISKIFGELITLIEPTKRLGAAEATKAILPYSGDEFGVPPNVYILGTMNTADRSIALLDTALRRRFDFVEMMSKPDLLSDLKPDGIDLEQMLKTINNRIEFLLDREHTIGHAYFLGDFAAHPTLEGLAAIFRKRIVPLLQEYFFEDYAKIRLVLGDASIKKNTPEFQFVLEEKGQAQELFPGVPADFGGPVNADHVLYRINDTASDKAKSYIGIYTKI